MDNGEGESNFEAELDEARRAFETIRLQAATLQLLGNSDELSGFLDRFIEMASHAAARAHEAGSSDYADSFLVLVQRAENFRKTMGV